MDKSTRKTSFTQWLTPTNQTLFEEQVETYQLDHYTKKLHMDSFMSLLLFAQLHETESLRTLSDAVYSDDLQQAIGLGSISFSQLGRRLNQVPTSFFQSIFLDLVSQIHEKTQFQKRRKMTTPLNIIDSSTLPLNLTNHRCRIPKNKIRCQAPFTTKHACMFLIVAIWIMSVLIV